MNIVIPDNISTGELQLLPNGIAVATLEKLIIGKSQTNNPKLTARFTIIEEMQEKMPDGSPTIGAVVLDTYSLQPQALFRLATDYKAYTGENLSSLQGDHSEEEFEAKMNEAMAGSMWTLQLEQQIPRDGSSTTPRTVIVKKTIKR